MGYVGVSIRHVNDWRNYKAAGFEFSFWTTSNPVYNNDGQVIEVWCGNQRIFYRELYGNIGGQGFTAGADATWPTYKEAGSRHTFGVTIKTYDKKGHGDFNASASATGYSWYTPRINLSSFKVTGGAATSSIVTYSSLDTPQNERLSYQNWNEDGYRQVAAGSKNGTLSYTGLPKNTSKQLAFGMIASNVDNGYLGEGEARRVFPTIYPAYSALTKGAIAAEIIRSKTNTVKVTWGAWSNFGNMTGWSAAIEILKKGTTTVIKTQAINSKVANSVEVTGINADGEISARIKVSGKYHDNTTKTEYSSRIELGSFFTGLVFVNNSWRTLAGGYVFINGEWRRLAAPPKIRVGSTWK